MNNRLFICANSIFKGGIVKWGATLHYGWALQSCKSLAPAINAIIFMLGVLRNQLIRNNNMKNWSLYLHLQVNDALPLP